MGSGVSINDFAGAFGDSHNSFKGASINYNLLLKGHSYNKVFTGAFINK